MATVNERHVSISDEEYMTLLKRSRNLSAIKDVFESALKRKSKRKMFNIVTETWNPVSGCLYNCRYCWARQLAETKLRNSHRYSQGFKPMLNEHEFTVKFNSGDFVFVSDMGDLFGDFIPSEWIHRVLEHTALFPEAYFLFLTKNPARYLDFLFEMPKNAILGATIETNLDDVFHIDDMSRAPSPSKRYAAMRDLEWDKKMVSVEPILDFNLETFSSWISNILPFLAYIGYDNYGNKLPEPALNKTLSLIERISEDTLVVKKTIREAWFEPEKNNK